MEISLEGKVALVTGASRGIGKAIAQAYADAGASVLLSSRKLADLEAAAAEIGGDVDVIAANAGDPDQAAAAVDRCIERFGGIDILVNNAATNPYMGPTMDIDLPRYDKTWEVNLRGPLVWTQLAWKRSMRERPGARSSTSRRSAGCRRAVDRHLQRHQGGAASTSPARWPPSWRRRCG